MRVAWALRSAVARIVASNIGAFRQVCVRVCARTHVLACMFVCVCACLSYMCVCFYRNAQNKAEMLRT